MTTILNPEWVRAGKTTSNALEFIAHNLYSTLEGRADYTLEQAALALEEAYKEIEKLTTNKAALQVKLAAAEYVLNLGTRAAIIR